MAATIRPIPLDLNKLKDWVRVDLAEDDDTLNRLCAAATTVAETYTGRTFNTAAETPEPVQHAIAIMVADWYTNREGELRSMKAAEMLLNPYRNTIL